MNYFFIATQTQLSLSLSLTDVKPKRQEAFVWFLGLTQVTSHEPI